MKPAIALLVCSLAFGSTTVAELNGSDDFNDNIQDTNKWSVYSGLLSETNNRLEYVTSESETEAGIWLWILNTGSYAQDWTVSMDAHNSISPSGSEEYEVCLMVLNSADYDDFFDIDLEIKGSTPYLISSGWGTNDVDGIWVDVSIGNTNDASLKIAFDSITKTLVSSYDVGNGYATLNSVNVSDWGIDGFRIAILCESEGIIVPSGQMYTDNFQAVTFPYNAVITNYYTEGAGFTLEWIPLAGLDSVVKWSTNLVNTPFTDLSPALPYPQNSYTDTLYGAEDECFYQVEVRQEGGIDFDVGINFSATDGTTITDASGTRFVWGENEFRDTTLIYAEKYWGTYPLYLPGNIADIDILCGYNGSSAQETVRVVTEVYTLNLDGSNGSLIYGPNTTDVVLSSGITTILDSSFQVPMQPKGLMRFIANLYHEGTLVLTEEAIFCPPDASVLE